MGHRLRGRQLVSPRRDHRQHCPSYNRWPDDPGRHRAWHLRVLREVERRRILQRCDDPLGRGRLSLLGGDEMREEECPCKSGAFCDLGRAKTTLISSAAYHRQCEIAPFPVREEWPTIQPRCSRHYVLRTCIGLRREARHAGNTQAIATTTSSVPDTVMKTVGSSGAVS